MATAKIPKSALRFSDDLHVEFAEDDSKKASMMAYSGKPMRHPLFGDLVVDVSGIKFQSSKNPILEDHDEDRKVGFSKGKPSTENYQVNFSDITLLENEVAQEFYQNAQKGFPYQASISFYPKKVEKVEEGASAEVNGFTQKGPAIIFRESVFREASVVTFGMDHRTSSVPQSEDTVSVVLSSKESADILNSFLESGEAEVTETHSEGDDAAEFLASTDSPRTTTHNGTETTDCDSVSKTFKVYDKEFGENENEKEDYMSEEQVKEYEAQIQKYEEKLSEYDQRMYELQKQSVQTDLTHKLGDENAAWLMKFYDNLSPEQLSEISDKILEFHGIINELGKSQGTDSGSEESKKEPSYDEVKKFAEDNNLSFTEANKQLYIKYQAQ